MKAATMTLPGRSSEARGPRSPIIEVEHLRKAYGSTAAVRDVSFSVGRGEIFGLLGLNGAGKTTIVESLQGLRRPDDGRMSVLGLDPVRQTHELRRRIGSQLQESALPDRIKVWEALDLFASGSSGSDWRVLLEQWGLQGKERATFGSLSGGQRQRLFVALALQNDPEVVFLDELTQGLDPAARRVAWDLIRAIRDRGTTVVLVTHYMDEAEQLSDRLAVVHRGALVAEDTPQGLVTRFGRWVDVRFGTDRTDLDWLERIPGVDRVARRGPVVDVQGAGAMPALVAAELVAHGIVPDDLQIRRPSLEDVFLEITNEGGDA
jgi:ABC-2 type transport system ATP-binding protein